MINNFVDTRPGAQPGNIGSYGGSPGSLGWNGGAYNPNGATSGGGNGGGGGVPVGGISGTQYLTSTLGTTLAQILFSIYATNKQVDASDRAAQLQAQATAEALAFTRAQAEAQFQNDEVTRHANYDQWAAQRRRLGTLGDMLGLPAPEIPAYAPGIDPHFTGIANGTSSGAQPTTGAIDPSKGDLAAQISGFFKSRGVSDQETPYWVSKWPELVARGQQLNDPNYAMKRLAAADIFGGQSAAPRTLPPTSTANTLGSMVTRYQTPTVAPALTAPTAYPQPGTLGGFLRY